MSGPVSVFTSKLVTLTEFAITPNDDEALLVWCLKKGTIGFVKGLDSLTQLIEKIVGFLYEKAKIIYNSEQFQNGKGVVVDYATRAKDFIVEHATQIYRSLSTLQRPAGSQVPN
ncbi:MAG: hypothetical protein JSS30_00485 [Verrucomicrobia bacterium]|nr:hypothetical protein [Verrucomicrobiota bacterium]